MDEERIERINKKLLRELGSTVAQALEDPEVIEIMLNPDGRLWIERLDKGMAQAGRMSAASAEALMATIATSLNTIITRENPILEGELPIDGSRFEGLIPPVVPHPTFTIRKRASAVFTLEDYVRRGIMDDMQRIAIQRAVQERKNLLIVGGTSSGKTTLTNAVIGEIVRTHPDHRLVILEDTAEIQCSAPNAVLLHTSDTVDMQRLLRATLRLRPDRILVGEVRGGEALALLKAWNTGHPGGVATLHANSAYAGLVRLEQLIGEVTSTAMHPLIAEAIDIVIAIENTAQGRRITEIVKVNRYESSRYQVHTVSVHQREKSIHEQAQ